MTPTRPLDRDPNGDRSFECPTRPRLNDLDSVHRTLPVFQADNEDLEVLQDETGLAVLDEQTAGFIIDNLR